MNQSYKAVNHIIIGKNLMNIGFKFDMIPRARRCAFIIVHGLLDSSLYGTVTRGRFFMLTRELPRLSGVDLILLQICRET